MIPLRDTIPSATFPIVTIVLIAANALIFFYQLFLGPELNAFVQVFGIIPAKYFWLADFKPGDWGDRFMPLLSSMFLHGGWMHVIGNMWYLWIFGDNVEDRMGHGRFFVFYIFCGVAAGLTHIYLNSASRIPTIGASGAVAGVMGAYLFLFPRSRVVTLLPIFIFIQIIEIPAFFFLAFWFLLQFFQGTASIMAGETLGGVAWWAHFGGFVVGAILSLFFRKPRTERIEVFEKDGINEWE